MYSGSSRLSLLPKRKKGGSDIIMSGQSQQPRGGYVTQRVLSAKTHRVKQLQNQLADAHFHLQVRIVSIAIQRGDAVNTYVRYLNTIK